ncbi:MAG: hypothetical protein N2510_03330 [Ignavibacteria bacterium]|nr:hypothetical protein [Ignavibacteria bacterium]
MRTLFVILFINFPIFSQGSQILSFNELYEALLGGSNVNAVIKYKDCRLVSDNVEYESPDATGGMEITPFEYFARGIVGNDKAFISSSKTVLIYLKKYGHVYNYVKLKLIEDGNVEITARYLTTDKYEVKMDETFYCKINDGTNAGGVYLFRK